ncbi:hypothetical protein PG996_007920 [Apiospora saccharicola]|uniref:Uncharacterized protein n=1 Tax=Apiospora saccharicola TaxID=335842 RepID=A0ABR1UWH1_9PEZI
MHDCFTTRCFTTALDAVGGLGRERVGVRMVERMEALEAEQRARRQQRAAAQLAAASTPAKALASTTSATNTTDGTAVSAPNDTTVTTL